MNSEKIKAILASAYNTHTAETTKAGASMRPSTIGDFDLSADRKEFLLCRYLEYSRADKGRLHSDAEIMAAIDAARAGSL